MPIVARVPLNVTVGGGWTAHEGLLGDPSPIASVVFHTSDWDCGDGKGSEITLGIDLDKAIFIGHDPASGIIVPDDAMTQIIGPMNVQRRALLFATPARPMLESFGRMMDTNSFIVPTSKRIIWVWIAISLALPIVMGVVFILCKHYWR